MIHRPYIGHCKTYPIWKAQDFWIAHAFATLTTSPEFGETSVSILTPAPYSLDKFLHLDGHRVFLGCFCVLLQAACVIVQGFKALSGQPLLIPADLSAASLQ